MKKEDFIKYCNEHWNVEWYEMSHALGTMEECRCPLHMTGDAIVDHIRELANDFIIDNDLDGDWFYNNFEDEEELFWALDEKWFDPKNYDE